MKYIVLIICCLFFSESNVCGQSRTSDSLKTVLRKVVEENKSDTSIAASYYHLALLDEGKHPDLAIEVYLYNINFVQNTLNRIPASEEAIRKRLYKILADSYNNAGDLYVGNDMSKALEYDYKSLDIYKFIDDRWGIADALGDLGEVYFMKGDMTKAKEFGTLSFEAGKQIASLDLLKNNSFLLQKILRKQGKFDEAFATYDRYVQLRDSIRIRENRLFTRSQEEQLLMEKKATEDSIRYMDAQREILHLKVQKQKQALQYLISGGALLILISIIAFVSYYRKRRGDFRREVLETKMKALRAQMNPHFTFNVLNSIQYYAGENDLKSVQHYLRQLSKLMRMILDQSRSSYVLLEQVITMQKVYLELEQMRFENKFNYEFEVAENLDTGKILIPDMLIQPIIENAIKHGIEHKEGEALIKVSYHSEKNILICTVSDNGVGRAEAKRLKSEKEEHASTATSIIQERMDALNALYNIHLQFRTEDLFDDEGKPSGTSVIIELPVENI